MSREIKLKQRYLREQSKLYPPSLLELPRSQWPCTMENMREAPIRVLRSNRFLVQVFNGRADGVLRMSVCRTAIGEDGRWLDGVSWEELQALKEEAGYSAKWAVEIFPADAEIVNVANMRHLWLLNEAPEFALRGAPGGE